MECCDPTPIRIKEPTSRIVKTGYLRIYERGWKERYFKLYDDSSLLWYYINKYDHHKGGIRLKMVANFIAVGPMCLHTVGFPKLPEGRHVIHLMGVPDIFIKGTKQGQLKMNWILFPTSEGVMQEWLEAIKPTLPHPPPKPEHPHHSRNDHEVRPYPSLNVVRYQPQGEHSINREEGNISNIPTGIILEGAEGYGLDGYGAGCGWDWGWGWGPHPYGGFWGSWCDFGDDGSVNIDRIVDDLCEDNKDYGYDTNDVGDFETGDFGGGGGNDCRCCDEGYSCYEDCCGDSGRVGDGVDREYSERDFGCGG